MDISSYFNHFITHTRPSREQLEKEHQLFTSLKKQLHERVESDGPYHLEKIFLAGSTAKHTDLKDSSDIDLGIYYRSQGRTPQELNRLLMYTYERLSGLYPPEKPTQDVHKGKNAINVTLRTRKMKVDVVPIIRDAYLEQRNGGYIPREDKWRFTSITHHIHFVHSRTARSKQVRGPVKFNHLVRLMKWWNRHFLPEHLKQCSYFYELITAAALEKDNVKDTYQNSLCHIFEFYSKHAFVEPIIFDDYYKPKTIKRPDNLVIVLDAVNPNNNITRKWDNKIRQDYLTSIERTYDLIKQAQAYEQDRKKDAALRYWCRIFGDDFQRMGQ